MNRSAECLGADLRDLVLHAPSIDAATVMSSLQYFLYSDDRSYADRLGEAVGQIASQGGLRSSAGRAREHARS